jgi:hypothetical protein
MAFIGTAAHMLLGVRDRYSWKSPEQPELIYVVAALWYFPHKYVPHSLASCRATGSTMLLAAVETLHKRQAHCRALKANTLPDDQKHKRCTAQSLHSLLWSRSQCAEHVAYLKTGKRSVKNC